MKSTSHLTPVLHVRLHVKEFLKFKFGSQLLNIVIINCPVQVEDH